MLSSTSSSDARLPHGPWLKVLFGGLLVAAGFAGVLELRLAARHYQPAVADSEDLWASERHRAAELGDRALILVGASRIQLDTDLDVLRRKTGLEPVQLAIDGNSFVPVLQSLADDARVTGTVIVDFAPRAVGEWERSDAASQYAGDYERQRHRFRINAEASEEVLTRWRSQLLRSYADGATPLSSLRKRVLSPQPVPQYLLMRPDRSRLADYRRVPMPDFYYGRVLLALGRPPELEPGSTVAQVESNLHATIAALPTADVDPFRRRLADLDGLVAAIQARGGRVIVVAFPVSGFIRDIDERHYPRARFWDAFARNTQSRTLHFEDDPRLRGFVCPDGSHLDFRDRAAFTSALVDALGLAGTAPDAAAVSAAAR